MSEETKETRLVTDTWDLSIYKWKVEVNGLKLLVDGLKDRKILGRKCHRCGTVYIPGVTYCRKCFIDIHEVKEVGTKGTVATFTVNLADVRGNLLDQPQVVCCFRLDGADSWLMGSLVIDDWHKVHVGMPVRLCFQEQTRGVLADIDHWEPLAG